MVILRFLAFLFYRLLVATWRIEIERHPAAESLVSENKQFIFAHWHCDIQALTQLMLRHKVAAMISRSKDGDLVTYIVEMLGGQAARGSSSKGGSSALKEMIRFVRSGCIASLAIDGPRGPAHVPKFGVFELSKICKIPIIPLGVACNPVYTFKKAWDGGYVPHPFARVVIYYAEPIPAPTEFSDEDRTRLPQELTNRMHGAKQHAANLIAAH